MEPDNLKRLIEGILLAYGEPITLDRMLGLFDENERPERKDLKELLQAMMDEYADRGFGLIETASGYSFQVKAEHAHWIARLWEEKPAKYSRALLETLVIIAYRQPVTRAEIEDIRGVAVSTSIIKTLQEREWIKVLGTKDIPGKPTIFGTTKEFLDYFSLKSLEELPTLEAIKDIDGLQDKVEQQLELPVAEEKATKQDSELEIATDEVVSTDVSEEEHDAIPEEDINLDAIFAEVADIETHKKIDFQAAMDAHFNPESEEDLAESQEEVELET